MIKNVTISMDEGLAHRVRVAAAQEGKSLSRYVADLLATQVGRTSQAEAARAFLSGPLWELTDDEGRLPAREDIYAGREQTLLRRHQRVPVRARPDRRSKEGSGG